MHRRNTQQRKIIYDILASTNLHPTADWIYEQVRKVIPNISLGTVYRNLKVLKDQGLILEINDGKQSRFDARIDNHYHFRCDSCGKIYDIEPEMVRFEINLESMRKAGFSVCSFNIELSGVCKSCQGEKKSEENN